VQGVGSDRDLTQTGSERGHQSTGEIRCAVRASTSTSFNELPVPELIGCDASLQEVKSLITAEGHDYEPACRRQAAAIPLNGEGVTVADAEILPTGSPSWRAPMGR
jgi:hypothetical protein